MAEERIQSPGLTREELMERGWTRGILQRNPADERRGEMEVWTQDYVAQVEALPEVRRVIDETLREREQTARMRQVPRSRIPELLKQGGELLTRALEQTLETSELPEDQAADVRALALFCHEQVLEPVSTQQALDLDKRAKYRPRAEEIRVSFRKSWSVHHLRSGGLRAMRRHRWVLAYLPELEELAGKYAANLVRFVRRSLTELRETDESVPVEELLSVPKVREQFPGRRPSLKENYNLYYIQGIIQLKLERLLAVAPKDEYPEARAMERRFIIHVGGTNTGKTYSALKRLEEVWTGAYLAPLRLLALEVQERLLAAGQGKRRISSPERPMWQAPWRKPNCTPDTMWR